MYNDGFRVSALNWFAQHRADEAREFALKVLETPDSERLRVGSIETLGRLKDKPNERRVFNALAKIARESSFGARSAAIRALQAYGDPAAIPAIQSAQNHSLHYLRNTAKGAIAALGSAGAKP